MSDSGGGGSFGGAAAFLGGLSRGLELGESIAQRSRRKEAAEWASEYTRQLSQINARRQENTLKIADLGHLQKTTGLNPEEFAEYENRIINAMGINSEANIAARDLYSRFAAGGASNEFIRESATQFNESLIQQEAQDMEVISKWQQTARDMAQQQQMDAQLKETKRSNVEDETLGRDQLGEQTRSNIRGEGQLDQQIGISRGHLDVARAQESRFARNDRFGTWAQKEGADIDWATVAVSKGRLSLDQVREKREAAQEWTRIDVAKAGQALDQYKFDTTFDYNAIQDAIDNSFTESRLKLDELMTTEKLTQGEYDRRMGIVAADLSERQHILEKHKYKELQRQFDADFGAQESRFARDLDFRQSAEGRRHSEALESLDQQQQVIDNLEDQRGDENWLEGVKVRQQARQFSVTSRQTDRGLDQRDRELDIGEYQFGQTGARQDRELDQGDRRLGQTDEDLRQGRERLQQAWKSIDIDESKVRLQELGIDLERVQVGAQIKQMAFDEARAAAAYDDLGEATVDKAFEDAATVVDQKLSGPEAQRTMNEKAVEMNLDPTLDSEVIRWRMISEEADLGLDEKRAAIKNEKPRREVLREAPLRERGIKVAKIQLRLAEIEDELSRLGGDGIFAHLKRGIVGEDNVKATRAKEFALERRQLKAELAKLDQTTADEKAAAARRKGR